MHPHTRCLAPSLELESESDFKADETDSWCAVPASAEAKNWPGTLALVSILNAPPVKSSGRRWLGVKRDDPFRALFGFAASRR